MFYPTKEQADKAVWIHNRNLTKREHLANGCGLFGLMLMAFGLAPSKAAQNIGMLLMLIGIVLSGRLAWERFWSDPLFWLCFSWIGYVLLSAWCFSVQEPEFAAAHWDQGRKMLRLVYLPITAWWLAADFRRIQLVLLLVLFGILFAILAYADWRNLISVLVDGAPPIRSGFGINAQHFGLLCLLALLGLAAHYSKWIGSSPGLWSLVRTLLLILVVLLLLVAFIITQVRAVWFAFAIIFGLSMVAGVANLFRYRRRRYLNGGWALVPLVMICIFIYMQWGTIKHRMVPELQVASEYLLEKKAPDSMSSMYIRLRLWSIAKDGIVSRPIFGWGPAGEKKLISEAIDEPDYVRTFSHVHNSFLSLAVRTGLVGVVFFGVAAVLIGKTTKKAWRHGYLDGRMAFYFFAVFAVFLFANLAESYLDRQLGWFVAALFGGASYSFAFHSFEGDKACSDDG